MRKTHGPVSSTSPSEEDAFELGGIFTSFKDQLINFTAKPSCSYSFADAATRMARLLEAEAVRQQYRSAEFLPEMWQNGNSNRSGRPARNPKGMAANLSGNASGHRTLSKKARKAISDAQRNRWRKFHQQEEAGKAGWTPARRKKYSKMMKAKWADPKVGKKLRRNLLNAQLGRTVSPETRAKISAAQRAAWDAKRGAA